MLDRNGFGLRLKKLRKAHGLTQEQLARELSITTDYLSTVELSKHTPSVELMIQICDYFSVTLDYLVKGKSYSSQEAQSVIQRLIAVLRQWEQECG